MKRIITKNSLIDLNKPEIRYCYAISPRGNPLFNYATGKTYVEAFDKFLDLFEEELSNYSGICEIRESDEHKDNGLITLVGRVISPLKILGVKIDNGEQNGN